MFFSFGTALRFLWGLFFFLFSVDFSVSKSLEISFHVDGLPRESLAFLYRHPSFSAGFLVRYSPSHTGEVMGGFNTPYLSMGHLNDSGLAAEIRSPGYSAFSRLGEKTRYRADLRTISTSRLGLSFMPWQGRLGLVYEQREEVESAAFWLLPLSGRLWTLEFLLNAGKLRKPVSASSWYPEKKPRAGGAFGLSTFRLRYHPRYGTVGITGMLSGAKSLNPGFLTALAFSYSKGPWWLRFRSIYASYSFRNADGEQLERPQGFSFDGRYRPTRGGQISWAYSGGLQKNFLLPPHFVDDASVTLAWLFPTMMMGLESQANFLFSGSQNSEHFLDHLKFRFEWDPPWGHFTFLNTFKPDEGWSWRLEWGNPRQHRWTINFFSHLFQSKTAFSVDLGLKTRFQWARNHLLFNLFWSPTKGLSGPASAGDFDIELRWIRTLAKD